MRLVSDGRFGLWSRVTAVGFSRPPARLNNTARESPWHSPRSDTKCTHEPEHGRPSDRTFVALLPVSHRKRLVSGRNDHTYHVGNVQAIHIRHAQHDRGSTERAVHRGVCTSTFSTEGDMSTTAKRRGATTDDHDGSHERFVPLRIACSTVCTVAFSAVGMSSGKLLCEKSTSGTISRSR